MLPNLEEIPVLVLFFLAFEYHDGYMYGQCKKCRSSFLENVVVVWPSYSIKHSSIS